MQAAPISPSGPALPRRLIFLCCLASGFVARGLVIWAQPGELVHDRDAYLALAGEIVAGRGYIDPVSGSPTAYRPPLYPLSLALGMLAFSPAVTVATLNLLWFVVTAWAIWRAGLWLGLETFSLFAALLVAIDPMLVHYTTQPMTEVTCAGIVSLLVCRVARPDGGRWRELTIGGLFGLLVLCRPTFWPLAGLALVVWVASRLRRPSQTRFPWMTVAGTALVIAPWLIRNALVMGSPILTTTHGGYTVLLANNPVFYADVVDRPWGTEWERDSFDRWHDDLQANMASELGVGASEQDRDRWQSRRAWRFIVREPGRFATAVMYRIRSLWSVRPQGDAAARVGSFRLRMVGWFYGLELIATAVGAVIIVLRLLGTRSEVSPGWWFPVALIVTVQAVHLVYWTNARMRAPILPAMALLALAPMRPARIAESARCENSAT